LIVKKRGNSISQQKLEAILRRIPISHSKRSKVEDDLKMCISGIKGEQSLDYYLNFLDQWNFYIFQSLRIEGENGAFQLDFLIITYGFLLIIETKNYIGEIIIDEKYNQLIKMYKDKEEIYPDPIRQVIHQKYQLNNWLSKNKFPQIPIKTLVVFTNQNSIIKTVATSPIYYENIIRPTMLIGKINSMSQSHNRDIISNPVIKKLNKTLLKAHSPLIEDKVKKFELNSEDIIKGVICPKCENIMKREYGRWHCQKCDTVSKDAHIQAIKDYTLLFDQNFSNSEISEFLNLSSRSTYNLLAKINLKSTGTYKGRRYFLDLSSMEN
jgi:ribosomal protein S27AE